MDNNKLTEEQNRLLMKKMWTILVITAVFYMCIMSWACSNLEEGILL